MAKFITLDYDNSATITCGAWEISVRTEHDDTHGTPWDNEDGHGPVTSWTSSAKEPGQLVLSDNNPSGLRGNTKHRYYDYAAACKLAQRDGWGFLPAPLKTCELDNGIWAASYNQPNAPYATITAHGANVNQAVTALYAAHRATYPSKRAYAAAAARADYDRLAAWCNDQWHYIGVIVTVTHVQTGIELGSASVWGIESDSGDEYLIETANELVQEALDNARATVRSIAA